MTPLLIGLCGRSGAGKDVVASHLAECHGFRRLAVADRLKDIAGLAFDLTREQLWGKQRNSLDPRWGKTPRELYQELGDSLRRIHPRALLRSWRAAVEAALHDGYSVVVPDIRTPAEAAALHELGGQLWRVFRPGMQLSGAAAEHATETISDSFTVRLVLRNVAGVEELRAAAEVAYRTGEEAWRQVSSTRVV